MVSHKTSGNVFVDYFTNITQETSRETIAEAVRQMVEYARVMFLESGDTTYISYLFTFWAFKRSCAETGEVFAQHHTGISLNYSSISQTQCVRWHAMDCGRGYWKDIEHYHSTPY